MQEVFAPSSAGGAPQIPDKQIEAAFESAGSFYDNEDGRPGPRGETVPLKQLTPREMGAERENNDKFSTLLNNKLSLTLDEEKLPKRSQM